MSDQQNDVLKPLDATAEELPADLMFPNRLQFTGVFIDIIRQIFLPGNTLLHPQLAGYFWQDESVPLSDPTQTPYQVMIEDVLSFKPDEVARRPAIFVKAGTWTNERITINDRVFELDHDGFISKIRGSHVIYVVGKTPANVELLAREVYSYLTGFHTKIMCALGVERMQIMELSEPAELEEASENFVIGISIQYSLTHAWRVDPVVSRLLRDIVVTRIMRS